MASYLTRRREHNQSACNQKPNKERTQRILESPALLRSSFRVFQACGVEVREQLLSRCARRLTPERRIELQRSWPEHRFLLEDGREATEARKRDERKGTPPPETQEWLRRNISGDQRAIEAQHTHKTPV
jgi:hypothetical protein